MGVVKDLMQIAKIVATVSLLFNFNSMQENELKSYVKSQQYEWIEKRRTEQEVEEMINRWKTIENKKL